MGKYIIPVYDSVREEVYNITIVAKSMSDCIDKLANNKFSDYTDADNYEDLCYDLEQEGFVLGEIKDIEEL